MVTGFVDVISADVETDFAPMNDGTEFYEQHKTLNGRDWMDIRLCANK